MKKLFLCVLLITVMFVLGCSSSKSKEPDYVLDTTIFDSEIPQEIDTGNLELQFGELLSVRYSPEKTIIIKAKITPNLTNKMTVTQNYMNVGLLIQKNGFDACKEIQYWAVADMTDGSESKVISFTIDEKTILALKNSSISYDDIANEATELFIHPSLQ